MSPGRTALAIAGGAAVLVAVAVLIDRTLPIVDGDQIDELASEQPAPPVPPAAPAAPAEPNA